MIKLVPGKLYIISKPLIGRDKNDNDAELFYKGVYKSTIIKQDAVVMFLGKHKPTFRLPLQGFSFVLAGGQIIRVVTEEFRKIAKQLK